MDPATNRLVTITDVRAWEDDFNRVALLGTYRLENSIFQAGWTRGRHDVRTGGKRTLDGFYVEAGHNVSPAATVYARYDRVDRDVANGVVRGPVAGVSYRASAVGRLVVEWQNIKDGMTRSNRVMTEFNWGF